ncbi:MAG: ATP-binding cassette domain-containing protein [Thermoplasmata archaeon]
MIVTEELTKRFPGRERPAIEQVNLEVRDGEILGLVGLNGAGKTTAIRVAAGVALPTEGRVLVDGRDIVTEKRLASE